jgi:hypothetical protein
MHIAKPSVSEPSSFEDEIAFEKMERYEKPEINHTPIELIQNFLRSTNLFILFGIRRIVTQVEGI